MSREIYQETKITIEWNELYARALDYKDTSGNYKIDHICVYKGAYRNYKHGDLIKLTNFNDDTNNIYFYIDKAEDIKSDDCCSLLTGYWVWSVFAGIVKSVDDLPQDAHEGEYYLVKPNDKTPIKDYKYYERIGDEWKRMGTYWR